MANKRHLRAVAAEPALEPPAGIDPDLALELEFGEAEDANIASDTRRAVLKEWSAADFANIYTRYRPHLERHARRWLRNQTQVDEVVQDAFLYLMVTLPELDSELGVLRFLKWKVKNLCIDVIRASNRAVMGSIDEVAEPASERPEVGSQIEQAEDAAIVRLALSKLNPRHREVLLASMYEEKSTREIASQVGLSENATLQLIHRARSAFKKALLGEDVNTEGMSVQAILSVAARKAAADVRKNGAQAMIFILVFALGITGLIGANQPAGPNGGTIVAEAPVTAEVKLGTGAASGSGAASTTVEQPVKAESAAPLAPANPSTTVVVANTVAGSSQVAGSIGSSSSSANLATGAFVNDYSDFEPRIEVITAGDLTSLAEQPTTAVAMRASVQPSVAGVQSLYLSAENGLAASLDFRASDPASITNARASLLVGGQTYLVFLPNGQLSRTFVDGNATYSYVAPLTQLIDGQNRVITGSMLNSQWITITITVQGVSDKVIGSNVSVGAPY